MIVACSRCVEDLAQIRRQRGLVVFQISKEYSPEVRGVGPRSLVGSEEECAELVLSDMLLSWVSLVRQDSVQTSRDRKRDSRRSQESLVVEGYG